MSELLAALADRFAAGFAPTTPALRTLGREAEFPVVHADGSPADTALLLPILHRNNPALREKREGSLLVALRDETTEFTLEVGRGTIEVVVGPADDLHALQALHEAARAQLFAAADELDVLVLGYGIQPAVTGTAELMTPKKRYSVLLDAIGPSWLWFTLTASDQVHVSVGRDELIRATNVCHLLTPVTLALCANSPIYDGTESGVLSSREQQMGVIHAGTHRHGLPAAPDSSFLDLVKRLCSHELLVLRRQGEMVAASGPFLQRLGTARLPMSEGLWEDFLLHEHYVWNSARPRSAIGTLELRAACQQPLNESGAAAALGAGMVCAWEELETYMTETLGPACWPTMLRWHQEVIGQGLNTVEPVGGMIRSVLDICARGLQARARGEEVLLQPLYDRLKTGANPAQRAQAVFRSEGMAGLLTHAARR